MHLQGFWRLKNARCSWSSERGAFACDSLLLRKRHTNKTRKRLIFLMVQHQVDHWCFKYYLYCWWVIHRWCGLREWRLGCLENPGGVCIKKSALIGSYQAPSGERLMQWKSRRTGGEEKPFAIWRALLSCILSHEKCFHFRPLIEFDGFKSNGKGHCHLTFAFCIFHWGMKSCFWLSTLEVGVIESIERW